MYQVIKPNTPENAAYNKAALAYNESVKKEAELRAFMNENKISSYDQMSDADLERFGIRWNGWEWEV